jgi:hypothetical protein
VRKFRGGSSRSVFLSLIVLRAFGAPVATFMPEASLFFVVVLVTHNAFAMLLAVFPLAFVVLAVGVSESAASVLEAVEVVSVVLRAVGEGELALTVELAVEPVSFVDRLVGIPHDAVAVGQAVSVFDLAFVAAAVSVFDDGLEFGLVDEISREQQLFAFGIPDSESAFDGSALLEDAFELVGAVVVPHLALPSHVSLADFSLVGDVVQIADQLSASVGEAIEITVVGKLLGGIEDAFASHFFVLPLAKVVFFLVIAFHPGLFSGEIFIA